MSKKAKKSVHVLIVEDSEDDALLVLMALKKEGYEVVSERVDTAKGMSSALEEGEWDIKFFVP